MSKKHGICDLEEVQILKARLRLVKIAARGLRTQMREKRIWIALLVKERDQWRECATRLAGQLKVYRHYHGAADIEALAAYERLKGTK